MEFTRRYKSPGHWCPPYHGASFTMASVALLLFLLTSTFSAFVLTDAGKLSLVRGHLCPIHVLSLAVVVVGGGGVGVVVVAVVVVILLLLLLLLLIINTTVICLLIFALLCEAVVRCSCHFLLLMTTIRTTNSHICSVSLNVGLRQ